MDTRYGMTIAWFPFSFFYLRIFWFDLGPCIALDGREGKRILGRIQCLWAWIVKLVTGELSLWSALSAAIQYITRIYRAQPDI